MTDLNLEQRESGRDVLAQTNTPKRREMLDANTIDQ